MSVMSVKSRMNPVIKWVQIPSVPPSRNSYGRSSSSSSSRGSGYGLDLGEGSLPSAYELIVDAVPNGKMSSTIVPLKSRVTMGCRDLWSGS